MKLILVYPNQTELDDLKDKHPFVPGYRPKPLVPLGMLYLCSNIDHDVEFIDNNIKKYSNDRLFKEIMKAKPDIVGFGGTMMEWIQAQKVSKMLHEADIPTIYGGPNATLNSEKHIHYFDYIVRGEGDITLNELLTALEKAKYLKTVKGIWFKQIDKIIKNPDRPFIENLDSLKYPARHLANLDDYDRIQIYSKERPCDVIVGSRGCPYNCRFCSSKYFWKRTYRYRDVNEVIEEVNFIIEKYGTKVVHFREDNFTVYRKRVFEFCDRLKEIDIKWICQSRVNDIDEKLIKKMKDAGCIGISFGFESANNHTLDYLNKGITLEESIKAIDICEKVGMNWSGGFMVGCPNETEGDIKRTLEFVRQIRKYTHCYLSPGAAQFLGFPVSETYFEMLNDSLVEYNWQDGELLIPRTRHISAKRVEEILYKDRLSGMDAFTKINNLIWWNIKGILPEKCRIFIRNLYHKIS
jgi:anaerobic magnesium-protoporphyrin IX monomethyl ester cyclase